MTIKAKLNAPKLLRDYLKSTLGFSTEMIKKLKNTEAGILVNGHKATVRYMLNDGDEISLLTEDLQSGDNIVPIDIPIDIIYEDSDMIAVNKPSGMPTHPSHNHYSDSLANALAFYFLKSKTPFVFRAVNRLDRETSGIVLVAKNKYSSALLCNMIANKNFIKTYYAVVHGALPDKIGIITTGIRRAKESIIFREVCPECEGQTAQTEYETIIKTDSLSLVRLIPRTGRTHQLRVHCAYMKAPIVCDGLYGDGEDFGLSHLALHAKTLSFVNPITNEKIVLDTPLPQRFKEIIK